MNDTFKTSSIVVWIAIETVLCTIVEMISSVALAIATGSTLLNKIITTIRKLSRKQFSIVYVQWEEKSWTSGNELSKKRIDTVEYAVVLVQVPATAIIISIKN